jgi:hypothetical protein
MLEHGPGYIELLVAACFSLFARCWRTSGSQSAAQLLRSLRQCHTSMSCRAASTGHSVVHAFSSAPALLTTAESNKEHRTSALAGKYMEKTAAAAAATEQQK